jgi:hypothetical protein
MEAKVIQPPSECPPRTGVFRRLLAIEVPWPFAIILIPIGATGLLATLAFAFSVYVRLLQSNL